MSITSANAPSERTEDLRTGDGLGQETLSGLAQTDPTGSGNARVAAQARILLLDGADAEPSSLRNQIFGAIQRGFSSRATWASWGPKVMQEQTGTLSVSLFPQVSADVLMMFDLADRRHFDQTDPGGTLLAAQFRRILVPGSWLKRRLTDPNGLGLPSGNVIVTGSPRIDLLRQMQRERAANPDHERGRKTVRVLVSPLHDNWKDRSGKPMSMRAGIEPFLAELGLICELTEIIDQRNTRDKEPATEVLLDADVVITDYTSLIYEAWALGKPVIFPRWLTGDRILAKAPHSAEAVIYGDRIGHHAESFPELCQLVLQGRSLDLGPGVAAFMDEYIDNYRGGDAGRAVARVLERLADPEQVLRETRLREAAAAAVKGKDWETAEPLLRDLLRHEPEDAGLLDQLAHALNAQGRWEQEIETLERLKRQRPADAALCTRLALAHERMERWSEAALARAEAVRLRASKASSDDYYLLGHALERAETDARAAAAAYAEACVRDKKYNAATLGIGALHASKGNWPLAREAYRLAVAERPLDPESRYRLGMAHDRCYEWAEAEACFVTALALAPSKSTWHYRLGFVLERQGRPDEAATAYLTAARLAKTHQPGWHYRAGYVLEQTGQPDRACAAYAMVLPGTELPEVPDPYTERLRTEHLRLLAEALARNPDDDAAWMARSKLLETAGDIQGATTAASEAMLRAAAPDAGYAKRYAALSAGRSDLRMIEARLERNATRPTEWQRYAGLLTAEGRLDEAIAALYQALDRSDEHKPLWHHQLGMLLVRVGQPEAACEAFRGQQILQRPHGVYETKFETDPALNETASYREFHDCLPIRPRTVLYEAFGGEGMSDNPRALFDALLVDPRFGGWTHVWVIEDPARIPPEFRARRDVVFIRKETTGYKRWLATAEYLINNATFPYYFVRRDGQKYLNTWHGTPLKTLGYDIAATPLQRANTARNLIQASLFIAPNTHTEEVMLDRYGVRKLFTGRSLITGYPRIDNLVNATAALKARLRTELGLDPAKPTVLYAPTYRGHWATPELETDEIVATINAMKDKGYNLVFRGHYFAEKTLLAMNLPVTIAPHAIDSCALLSIVDVLVSDYSSIFYDFLVTGRPVIHHVPDWDYYVETRGTYFGREALPGIVTETHEELRAALAACIADPKEHISDVYRDARARYCRMEDGQACRRVIEALFFDDCVPVQPVLPKGAGSILLHCGTLDDTPLTRSCRALTGVLRQMGHAVTLIVDRRHLIDNEPRTRAAQDMLDRADVLIRFGRACMTPEEAWINTRFDSPLFDPNAAMSEVFDCALAHEVRRLFGCARFDAVADLEGQRPFWRNILSATPARSRAIRLTGAQVGTPGAAADVALVTRRFDLHDREMVDAALAEQYGRVPVCVDAPTVLAHADVPSEVAGQDGDLAAMSKDQRRKVILPCPVANDATLAPMIEALRLLIEADHDPVLYVLGRLADPVGLRDWLQAADCLGRVVLLGEKPSSFPFLKAGECLVLLSPREVQGVALPEALTLGVPCVVVGDADTQDLLADNRGVLVGPDPESLAVGVALVLEGRFTPRPLDPEAYNRSVAQSFLATLGLAGGAR